GFTANTLNLANFTNFGLSYNSALVKSTGVTLNGIGSIRLAGLPFNFNAASPDGGSPGIELEGGLELPSNLSGVSIAGGVTVENSTVQLNSLEFCTPGGINSGVKIRGANMELP